MRYQQPLGADVDAPYIDGNPQRGIQGSSIPAAAIEYTQREIVNLIRSAGLVPNDNDLEQMLSALRILAALPYTDSFDYPIGARVIDANGVEKVCAILNGPATTVIDPAGDTTDTWIDRSADSGADNGADSDADIDADIGASFGEGYAWNNMSSSRALNVTYVNSTIRPVVVNIYLSYPSGNGNVGIYVDDVPVCFLSTLSADTLSAIVPPGSSYSLVPALQTVIPVIHFWSELRG